MEASHREVVKVLLQDSGFIANWKQVADALDIPTRDMFQMAARFNAGNVSMYEVIQWMLNTWRSRSGPEATLEKFILMMIEENLNYTAHLLQELVKSNSMVQPNVESHPPAPRLTQQESEAMIERHLEVLERIDSGSFSDVFKVKCIFDNKKFALKKICIGKFVKLTKPSGDGDGWEYFRKLIREVTNMAQAEHPNIVSYQEAWFEGPLRQRFSEWLKLKEIVPRMSTSSEPPSTRSNIEVSADEMATFMCIKMELMDTNLEHWLGSNTGRIGDFESTKFITKEILTGLSFIHSRNIVHRDLKPNNILISTPNGQQFIVKIGDFGLSRDMSAPDTSLTVQVGGKSYSSPEMERGDNYDLKTDIFSVGLICLVMLHRFDTAAKLERTLDNARRGDLEVLTIIEKTQQRNFDLLRRMLDIKPANRPTAAEAKDSMSR